jgi:hypothetical protein
VGGIRRPRPPALPAPFQTPIPLSYPPLPQRTVSAMAKVGIPPEQREAVLACVAAVLHLGNVVFVEGRDADSSMVKPGGVAEESLAAAGAGPRGPGGGAQGRASGALLRAGAGWLRVGTSARLPRNERSSPAAAGAARRFFATAVSGRVWVPTRVRDNMGWALGGGRCGLVS